ncbi:hypothetical protein ACNKHV_20245 [Shigella flexneri]
MVRIAGAGGFDDDVGISNAGFDRPDAGLPPTAIGAGTGRVIFS